LGFFTFRCGKLTDDELRDRLFEAVAASDIRTVTKRHLFGNGRLSYTQIPAASVRESAAFYASVFGWEIRGGSDNHLSFTDATGDMIGAWVTGRTASREPGVLPYIYVHGIDAAIGRIKANGGDVVKPPYDEGGLWVATFRDPTGNVLGIWQNGPR
jgi:predicted enzyme related to lactoylglutathione lyase